MAALLPVVKPEVCQDRLEMIFPKEAFASALSAQLAGRAVAGLIWAGCVMPDDNAELDRTLPYARPSTILWMNEDYFSITDEERRQGWYRASIRTKNKTHEFMANWNVPTTQWHADNTRETLRDDVYDPWMLNGAMLVAPHVDTTSGAPRWILRRSFAELFNPALNGAELNTAIDSWIQTHMSASARVRASLARSRARAAVGVNVHLPDGTVRTLSPGNSSLLIQGVVEGWASLRLNEPAVLTISESGDKVHVGDQQRLATLGIDISVTRLLPDALLVDLATDPLEFWIIEVVATDGPISERRKAKFHQWAETQGIPPENLRFLTAFLSRNHSTAKKLLPSLAAGTHAWFLDEPDHELTWGEIDSATP